MQALPAPPRRHMHQVQPGRTVRLSKPDGNDGPQVDSTAYYFRVTYSALGGYRLHVRHHAGDEAWSLGYEDNTIRALTRLDSNDRFHDPRGRAHRTRSCRQDLHASIHRRSIEKTQDPRAGDHTRLDRTSAALAKPFR